MNEADDGVSRGAEDGRRGSVSSLARWRLVAACWESGDPAHTADEEEDNAQDNEPG